ncbi:MAG: glycosyltransferase [Gammaproteobacteria bacterium]|nr:glycosyltransferase [Gammaproteobacteria bacterium]
MSKALVIGQVWPEPTSSAAGWNLINILQTLTQHYEVHFTSAAAPSVRQADLSALGMQCHTIALNDSSVDSWLIALNPDIVIFDRFMVEEQFGWRVREACPDALTVLDSEDIHCLRLGRQKDTAFDHATALREIAAIYRCDISLIISLHEQRWLQQTFGIPSQKLHYHPLTRTPIANPPSFEAREGFTTIGNFKHPPNADSVRWLSELWPAIRAKLPEANLYIYGAYADHRAMQLHKPKQGFHIIGPVDDAQAAIAKHRVMLAPLRYGAGLKGKFLDAMATGTPAVTTTIGAEGIAAIEGFPGGIADTDQEMIEAAVRLYRNAEHWQHAQQRAQTLLQTHFSSHQHQTALLSALDQAKSNLSSRRQQDFIGDMLRHQNHGYHKFMSRWIELKNQPK